MSVQTIYLDSSAIVKRYVKEDGSDLVRDLFLKAYSKEHILSYSFWNIGEVLGVFDRAYRIGRMNTSIYNFVRKKFLLETRRMMKLGLLLIVPVKTRILMDSWRIVEKYHIYEADAIQIITAKYVNASKLFSGDKRVCDIASQEKVNSYYLG